MNAWINTAHRFRFLGTGLLLAALSIARGPAAQAMVTYEPAPAGSPWGCCGVVFFADGVLHETLPFRWTNGLWTNGGFASIVPSCFGAPGNSLNINNVNVRIDPRDLIGGPGGPGVRKLSFRYQDCGGSVNLAVNGHHVWWHLDFADIPAAEYAGVGVLISDSRVWTGSCWEGTVTLESLPGACIEDIAIGGQELCIDDVEADLECNDCPGDIDGDGDVDVADLLLIFGAWGGAGGPEDINGDGAVDTGDLLIALSNWGSC